MKKAYALIISLCALSFSLQGCIPAIVAGVGAAAIGTNAAGSNLSLGTQIDDTTIKTKANAILKKYPQLTDNSNVEISVFNGVVLLLGQVPNSDLKSNIAKDISTLNGVRVVYNQLQVTSSITFSQYAKDSWITTRVTTKFIGNVNPAHFKVITENGVVYIMGVCTQAEGNMAADLASQIPNVSRVVTAYSILPPSAPAVIKSNESTDPNATNNDENEAKIPDSDN